MTPRGGLFLLLLAWAGLALALNTQQRNCSRTQYGASGKCCTRCPPGKSVHALCTEGSETVCVPCQDGHFQHTWTRESGCTPHRYCDPRNAMQNVICRCKDGTHCSGQECHICRENQLCGPGKGVTLPATHTSDTVCTECPMGSFSNVSSATATCQQWSSCEALGLVHKANGTRFTDTICEEAPKVHSGVWLPVALAAGIIIIALACGGLLLWHQRRHRHRQELQKWHQGQVDPLRLQPPHPVEDEEPCPGLPVEETSPEGIKDSRLAGEEQA